jgi:hypothetical protein
VPTNKYLRYNNPVMHQMSGLQSTPRQDLRACTRLHFYSRESLKSQKSISVYIGIIKIEIGKQITGIESLKEPQN